MKTIASILFLGLIAAATLADTAEVDAQFFHPAASHYIQGNSSTASNLVEKGLSIYPDDGKLKRLEELLKQQQEQKQDQENKDDQKQNQDQKKDEQQRDQDEQNQNQGDQDQQNQQQSKPQSAEEMSQDEAKQLMDAMKQEEQNKRLQLHPVMGAPVKVDKDW